MVNLVQIKNSRHSPCRLPMAETSTIRSSKSSSAFLSAETMAKLERMEFVSRKIFRGRMKGERRSKRKGQSVEFADFKNYVRGDDLRFIDWNLFARMDRLYLKIFSKKRIFISIPSSTIPCRWILANRASSWSPNKSPQVWPTSVCVAATAFRSQALKLRQPAVIRGKSSAHRFCHILILCRVSHRHDDGGIDQTVLRQEYRQGHCRINIRLDE